MKNEKKDGIKMSTDLPDDNDKDDDIFKPKGTLLYSVYQDEDCSIDKFIVYCHTYHTQKPMEGLLLFVPTKDEEDLEDEGTSKKE